MLFDKRFDRIDQNLIDFIARCIDDISDDQGWAHLAGLGNLILKKQPDFDSRIFGYNKLSMLIEALNDFEIQKIDNGTDKNVFTVLVRNK